jgi:hypothetical protein
MLNFLLNRTKKCWRKTYREELAQELESLKQRLVDYKYAVKIIEGKIAAAEAIQQSDILDYPVIAARQEIEKVLHTDENSVYNATTEQQ